MKCELCGKEFKRLGLHLYSKHNMDKEQQKEYYDKYLKKENEGVCQECGKPTSFLDITKGYRQFCSPKCSNMNKDKIEKIKQVLIDKYGVDTPLKLQEFKDKAKETSLKNYGTIHPMQSKEVQDKIKSTNLKKYGTEYAMSSDIVKEKLRQTCIEKYGVDNPWKAEEVQQKIKATNIKRYGTEYPTQLKEVKDKIARTNIEKYGVPCILQLPEIKKQIKETNLKKYGVEIASQSEKVKNKMSKTIQEKYGKKWYTETEDFKNRAKETSLEKYGTDYPMQSEEIQKKVKETNLKKYGTEYGLSNPDIQEKIKQTNLKKYGVEDIGSSKEIQEKIKQTNIERYGYDCIFKSPEFREKIANTNKERYGADIFAKCHIEHIEDWENLEYFLKENKNKYNSIQLAEYFNLTHRTIRKEIIKLSLQDYVKDFYVLSQPEMQFKQLLDSRLPNISYIMHDRKIIAPLELDFYFPEQNLAIEVSPTYTHQYREDITPGISDKEYHYSKFKACEDKGIELITAFDWEDTNKVLDLIENKMKNSTNVIYARNTDINYTDSITLEHKKFLNKNHVLDSINNKKDSFVLELRNRDSQELLGLAVYYPTKTKNQLELKRLAFKNNYTVVGGASKLLKNVFKYKQEITSIITFSDNNLGAGSVYKTIGFDLIEDNRYSCAYYNPQYDWTIKETSLWMQGTDRLLANFPGYEKVGIGEDLPRNDEIVISYGFVPVYDCGYRKWIYSRK